jgi:hypothetical protein
MGACRERQAAQNRECDDGGPEVHGSSYRQVSLTHVGETERVAEVQHAVLVAVLLFFCVLAQHLEVRQRMSIFLAIEVRIAKRAASARPEKIKAWSNRHSDERPALSLPKAN